MTTWIIISWVLVAILTAVNIFVFLKLKKASEQMMKMAFPGSKNMGDAMSQAQKMMASMSGGNPKNMEAQMKAAMNMLSQMQGGGGAPGGRPGGAKGRR